MSSQHEWTEGSITLRGTEVRVRHGQLPQSELSFYPENPRIYTMVQTGSSDPDQGMIQSALEKMDHVKLLMHSIRANNGLIEPLLVRDGDGTVLEGNSRLAAYRILAANDPIKWGYVKVTLLPEDISDALVFALLGEFHLKGKKDWAPYEQAGYFYRRIMNQGVELVTVASEMGLSKQKVQHLVNVYAFMLDRNETSIDRWSYYDEYFKSNPIRNARRENSTMDEQVVAKVRSGEIPRAIDIREKLSKIAKAGGKPLAMFLRDDNSFEDAFDLTADRTEWYNRLNRFRKQIANAEQDMNHLSDEQRKKCLYEIRQIQRIVTGLTKKLTV